MIMTIMTMIMIIMIIISSSSNSSRTCNISLLLYHRSVFDNNVTRYYLL